MQTVISFTPAQLWAGLLAVCGGITAVAAAVAVLGKTWARVRKPETDQNTKIKTLQGEINGLKEEVKELRAYLASDKKHLDALDEGNRVTQQALLALLGHAIDGNNLDQLTHARDHLHTYLVER